MGKRIGKIRKYLAMCSDLPAVRPPDDDGVEQLEFDFNTGMGKDDENGKD